MSLFTYTIPPSEVKDLPEYLRYQLKQIEMGMNTPLRFTADKFLSKESSVNRKYKMEGRFIWDTTSKKPVWATGDAPTADWIFGDGVVAYSPI